MLYATYTLSSCLLFVWSFTQIYKRNFDWDILEFLQKGYKICTNWRLNLILICYFWMLPKSFYNSFVLQMILIHSKTGWKQVDFRDFEKKENMWISKTQCRALLVSSKATFTKTAKIQNSKFIWFSLKNVSAAIYQCTIKIPSSCVHWKFFKLSNGDAKLSKCSSEAMT